jgi:hypothetical protein
MNPVFDRSRRARVTKVKASFAWRLGQRKRPRPRRRPSGLNGVTKGCNTLMERLASSLKGIV